MDRNKFNAEVRPFLTEIPLGKQAIAFDRLELDAWIDDYIECNGRPASRKLGDKLWDAKKRPDSLKGAKSGTSTKGSKVCELSSLLAQAASTKRKDT
ncbi:MAG: hypothetical protein OQK82_05010 [Candidatus Pacearchaeota archaeon]|nr:hypothetical protein [Candidatus Pacearchaeota archaeon]